MMRWKECVRGQKTTGTINLPTARGRKKRQTSNMANSTSSEIDATLHDQYKKKIGKYKRGGRLA